VASEPEHYLSLHINSEAVELEAVLPSGFKVKVTGDCKVIVGVLKSYWPEIKAALAQAKGVSG
jgi:hypothetical protein